MKRVTIVLFAVLIAAAAPARAWCEASCLAALHTPSATPHCPTHEPSSNGTQISAIDNSECPVIEAARPVPATQPVSALAVSVAAPGASAPPLLSTLTFRHSGNRALRHLRSVPLRI